MPLELIGKKVTVDAAFVMETNLFHMSWMAHGLVYLKVMKY